MPRKQLAVRGRKRERAFALGDWVRVCAADNVDCVGRVEEVLGGGDIVVRLLDDDQYDCVDDDDDEPVPRLGEEPRGDRIAFHKGHSDGGSYLYHLKS
jgi:hypothetical protein